MTFDDAWSITTPEYFALCAEDKKEFKQFDAEELSILEKMKNM